jgi:hypothetical protein
MKHDNDFETIISRDGRRVRVLRDGHRYRVRTRMMDADRRPLITDNQGRGGVHLNRPGFRTILSDQIGMSAKERAYRDYEKQLCDAYKADAAAPGAYPYSAAAEGAACTVDGRPGHLRKQGDALVCVPDKPSSARADAAAMKPCPDCDGEGVVDGDECPTCEGTGYVPEDYDEDDEDDEDVGERETSDARRIRAFDPRGREAGTEEIEEDDDVKSARRNDSVKQRARDHQSKMDELYAQRDRELTEAWRRTK